MTKIFKYLPLLILGLISCKNEDPFTTDMPEGSGRILTTDISLDIKSEQVVTRASSVPVAEDFTVAFCKSDNLTEAVYSYMYGEMPEVVTLPAGDYVVKAYYGNDNIDAAFDEPAYYGESPVLTVKNGMVLNVEDPIVCSLYNVRVSIIFDPELQAVMDSDAKVTVKVGESGSLDFDVNTDKDGFFKYSENSNTLAATFSGTVQGTKITEIKNYDNVKRGTYYKITFKLHNMNPGSDDPGNMTGNGSLMIDATLTSHDYSSDGGINVNPDKEEYLEDDRYPSSGGDDNNNGDDNNGDIDSDNPAANVTIPVIVSDDVDINKVNDISGWEEDQSLAVKILTRSKISKFICTIDSETLTPKELEDVNLKSRLDLINDTELFDNLGQLGFPVGDDITDPQTVDEYGNYVIIFDITKFVPMLNALGSGNHNFIFELQNEEGQSKITLKLKS